MTFFVRRRPPRVPRLTMMIHPTESQSRVQPLPTSSPTLTGEFRQTLALIPGDGLKGAGFPHNVLGQLLHSPQQFGPFLTYWVNGKNTMSLTIREQELIILRMAVLYHSDYVWRHHVLVGRAYSIDSYQLEELKKLKDKASRGQAVTFLRFNERERALLLLTDDMVENRSVNRKLWDDVQCKKLISNRELIDLIHLISQYTLFSLTNNVLQVPLEESMKEIPSLRY